MKRFIWVFVAILIAGVAVRVSYPAVAAVEQRSAARISNARVNPDALREMLNKGLKVTRDDQKAYIDRVVEHVAEDKLPVSLVYASFRYARTRRPQFPFPYFVYSLETLAKRNKIKFPSS